MTPSPHHAAAAELAEISTSVWRDSPELEQAASAGSMPRIRLEGAHVGLDVDEHLVLVVPHQYGEHHLPALVSALRSLRSEFGVDGVAFRFATPAEPQPGHQDRDRAAARSVAEILDPDSDEWLLEVLARGEEQIRARGSFTLELPVLEDLVAYVDLAEALERALWEISTMLEATDGPSS